MIKAGERSKLIYYDDLANSCEKVPYDNGDGDDAAATSAAAATGSSVACGDDGGISSSLSSPSSISSAVRCGSVADDGLAIDPFTTFVEVHELSVVTITAEDELDGVAGEAGTTTMAAADGATGDGDDNGVIGIADVVSTIGSNGAVYGTRTCARRGPRCITSSHDVHNA